LYRTIGLLAATVVSAGLATAVVASPAAAATADEYLDSGVSKDVGSERSLIRAIPTPTAEELARVAEKDRLAQQNYAVLMQAKADATASRSVSSVPVLAADGVVTATLPCVDGDCSWRMASVPHVAQSNGYYCGPATLVGLVKLRNVTISQSTAATRLGTTTDGTDWSNGTGYPMANALNYYLGTYGAYYAAVWVYDKTISATELTQYKTRLTMNINNNWGIAGDGHEPVNDNQRLVGHPINRDIWHWFAIKGYWNWGDVTRYMDSASSANVSWGSGVPQFSDLSSATIMHVLGDRGYVW